MPLRWLWFDHIPPELNVPREARRTVRRRAHLVATCGSWRSIIQHASLTVLFMVGLIVATIGVAVALQMTGGSRAIATVWLIASVVLLVWSMFALLSVHVRVTLCQIGYLCCVKCGYAHTGLSKDVKECPECGTPREFGKCVHCNSPQDWPMQPEDRCTQCGRKRFS